MEKHVILSEEKDLLKEDRASQDEILRFAQDDVAQLRITRWLITTSPAGLP